MNYLHVMKLFAALPETAGRHFFYLTEPFTSPYKKMFEDL